MQHLITRYLGIDFGTVRIGLALGDSAARVAIPFAVVENLEQVIAAIKDEDIDAVVIGVPLTMNNEQGGMKEMVLEFINKLKSQVDLPIIEIDERLSSKGADALIGSKKTKADRDAIAAMLILQNYLDRI